MKIDAIRAFVMVADRGSFSGAARDLFMSQPTVTRLVRELEEELQSQLINRDKKMCQLTQSGESIYPHCRTILKEYENIQKKTEKHHSEDNKSIRIGYTYGEMLPYLAESIASNSFPVKGLSFSMNYGEGTRIVQLLRDGKLDCAVMHLPSLPSSAGMEVHLICHCGLDVVMSKTHSLASQESILLDQLAQETDVRYVKEENFYAVADEAFQRMNKTEMKHHYVESIEEIMPNVICNQYVCIKPSIYPDWAGTTSVSVRDWVMDYSLVLICKTGNMNPLVQMLYTSLREHLNKA